MNELCVLASGSGSNFEEVVKAFPDCRVFLICDTPGAGVLARADRLGVPHLLLPWREFSKREEFDAALAQAIVKNSKSEWVVLAGFMRRLTSCYFSTLKSLAPNLRTINLHPAHREDYKGAHAYLYAVEHKFPRWGLSVHEAIPELDSGPLIASRELNVYPWDTKESLRNRAQKTEHDLLISALRQLLQSSERAPL